MIEEDANNVDGERKKKRRKNLCRKMCVSFFFSCKGRVVKIEPKFPKKC